MKGSDKAIVLGVLMAVILAAFYVKVLSPKREKATSLASDVTKLKTQIDQEKRVATFGEQARKDFPAYYGRLVVTGKAVPDQADTASLLVQLSAIANRTHVVFHGISLGSGSGDSSGSAAAAVPAPTSGSTTSTTSTTATPAATSSGAAATTPASPAPATEASAANLPIGATVGPAGLSTMPYNLTFTGDYLKVADFLKGVDSLVHSHDSGQVAADGRLMTIDGFSLAIKSGGTDPNPELNVAVAVTSYVTPADQGLTAGATPTAPPSLTQPTSATVSP